MSAYPPNTTPWQRGDYVIHDCDAKKPHMLMVVIGFTRDGLVKTRYVAHPLKKFQRRIWCNPMTWLHDPALWQITTP